ncbi:MAG: hypothetical protein M3Q70_00935 [bacterium]|nr:hypothetical protein [bacterium]
MINSELLQPATDAQLRQFSKRLDSVALRLTRNLNEFESVSFGTKIEHGEGDIWRLEFSGDFDGFDQYALSISNAVPVTRNTGPPNIVEMLACFGTDDSDIESINSRLSEEYGEPIDVRDDVEGYLECQNRLSIQRSSRAIQASKASMVNILDEDLVEVDCELGYCLDAFITDDEELHLVGDAPVILDLGFIEHCLTLPTAADLIIAANGLIKVGLLNPKTKAYTGAPHII